jgi:3-methyladenine DNA glycosylase AlkD
LMFAEELREKCLKLYNPEEAERIKSYSRNQFECIGLRAPQMKEVFKEYMKEKGLPKLETQNEVIEKLWSFPEREMQIIALYLLDKTKKLFQKDDMTLLEYIITTKPWWDTIDHIAKNHVSYYFSLFPEDKLSVIDKWMKSGNIWLMRCCILFQLRSKAKTDKELLISIIERSLGTNEFFIDKAIGWALREYGKTDEAFVRNLIEKLQLSPLSKREALRNLD